ncbi:MAG: amidohydrolase family protein [Pseudomonadota bacterium]|nr:amidohydrolase family protein [Pseudomonadota bacterium]
MSPGGAVIPLPPGSVDTHVHVLDPHRFRYAASASYLPAPHETGTVAELRCLLDAHGVDGVVIVDPTSGYNGDSRCMLDALERLGPRARGIARWVPEQSRFDRASLSALARHNVVGVRADFIGDGLSSLDYPAFAELIACLADLDLVLDVQCERDQMTRIAPALAESPVRVVVDHIGRPEPQTGVRQAGFDALLHLGQRGDVSVKLSGPMRMSSVPGWHDVDPFVQALVSELGTGALVWGSDWPFLRAQSRIDYAPLLSLVERWLPQAEDRQRVLASNPRALFGFETLNG